MVNLSNILFKKTRRELVKNFLQYLAIIFITALAVTLFSGLSSNASVLERRVKEIYEVGNVADIWTQVDIVSVNDRNEISKLAGPNSKTEERLILPSFVEKRNANAIIVDYMPSINKPYVLSDNYLDADGNFFLLDETTVSGLNELGASLEIGGPVDVSVSTANLEGIFESLGRTFFSLEYEDFLSYLDEHLIDASKSNILREQFLNFSFTLTGTMKHPENIENGEFFSAYYMLNYSLFSDTLHDLFLNTFDSEVMSIFSPLLKSFHMMNQYVTIVDDNYDVSAVKNDIMNHFQNASNHTLMACMERNNVPSVATIENDIVQARQLSYVFPSIFFVVAILVVLTTITQIILKERQQIGTMKALGIPNYRIVTHYMFLTILVCAIGAILGIIIGPLLIPFVMNQKYNILYSLPPSVYVFPCFEVILMLLALFAVSALVTYLICRKDMKLTPSQSMRPKVIKPKKHQFGTKRAQNSNKFGLKMAIRNIQNNIGNALMVIIGVAGCTALLVTGFGIEDTLNHGIDNDMSIFYNCDGMVTYQAGVSDGRSQLLNVEGIESIEDYSMSPATLSYKDNNYTTYCYAIQEDHQYFKVHFSSDTVAISTKIASENNLKVGDSFTFTVLGKQYEAKVGVLFEAFYVHGIYVNYENPMYAELGTSMSNAWIKVASGYDANSVIQSLANDEYSSIVSRVQTYDDLRSTITNILSSILVMTNTVKIFAILLAVIVLYNLAILNYRERMRDIATLKVLGFSRFEIAKSLIIEIMALTVVGVALGLALGMPMEILVLMTNETPVVDFLYVVWPLTYVIATLITLGTALIVNLYLTNMTNKIPMVESLKSVE